MLRVHCARGVQCTKRSLNPPERPIMRTLSAAVLVFAILSPSIAPATDDLTRSEEGDLFTLGQENHQHRSPLFERFGPELLVELPLTIDRSLLVSSRSPTAVRASARDTAPTSGTRFQIQLPFQKHVQWLQISSVEESPNGTVTYSGELEGDESSLVTLSFQSGATLGRILSNGRTYLLHGDTPSSTAMSVIQASRLPQEPELKYKSSNAALSRTKDGIGGLSGVSSARTEMGLISKSSGGGDVRVLILYTPAVAARNNIALLSSELISQFNQSLASSGVASSNYLTLAGTSEFQDNLSTLGARCRAELQTQMLQRSPPFQNLDTLRSSAYADIVVLLLTTESSYTDCGIAGRIGGVVAALGDSIHPFALVSDNYALADLTGPHEIGHVLGGGHEDDDLRYPYFARGFANRTSCAWQTVMGGYTGYQNGFGCDFDYTQTNPQFQPVSRLPRWSSPSVSYQGVPTGSSFQNMRSALESLMPTAASWVSDPPPPPPQNPPSSISAHPFSCNGSWEFVWPTVSGATGYRLYRSSTSSFSNPVLSHQTGYTSAVVNVGTSGTSYFRVQACNAGGCSGYSSQASATGYSGCI